MRIADVPRAPLIAVAALLVATGVGLAVYWPTGSTDAKVAKSLRLPTFTAEVVGVRVMECEIPQAQQCRRVEARLAEGPDEGQTTSFPTGASPAEPDFEPGDRIRLASSGPEAVAQGLDAYSFSDYERRAPMLWLLAASPAWSSSSDAGADSCPSSALARASAS